MVSVVTPNTFSALGIPLKRGRDFNDGDTRDAPFTAVINEALARSAFPGQDPIGRIIFCGFDSFKPMRIVGVVGDVRQSGPAQEPQSQIYMPYQQHSYNGSTLSVVVRTAADPGSLVETMRRKARERSLEVPVKFTTMEASLYENVAAPRFRTLLLGIFAGLAVCLAMAGVYGVMAYMVSQRKHSLLSLLYFCDFCGESLLCHRSLRGYESQKTSIQTNPLRCVTLSVDSSRRRAISMELYVEYGNRKEKTQTDFSIS